MKRPLTKFARLQIMFSLLTLFNDDDNDKDQQYVVQKTRHSGILLTQPQKIQKSRIISLLFDEEPSWIKLKYWNSLKQSYDGSVSISVSPEQMSVLLTSWQCCVRVMVNN